MRRSPDTKFRLSGGQKGREREGPKPFINPLTVAILHYLMQWRNRDGVRGGEGGGGGESVVFEKSSRDALYYDGYL